MIVLVADHEEGEPSQPQAGTLEERARRGSREKFEAVLRKVPSGEPDPWDRWDNAEPYQRPARR